MPSKHLPRVGIVGGGFAGLYAAKAMARHPVQVAVVDRHNAHLFQPLLYQVATAALSDGEVATPIRSILRKRPTVRAVLAEATAVDLATRTLRLRDEVRDDSLTYDYLILAPGSTHSYFGHPEWEAVAPGLKGVDDALEIRRRILSAFEAAEREPDPVARRAPRSPTSPAPVRPAPRARGAAGTRSSRSAGRAGWLGTRPSAPSRPRAPVCGRSRGASGWRPARSTGTSGLGPSRSNSPAPADGRC